MTQGSHSTLYVADKKKSKESVVIKKVANSSQREKENNLAEIAFMTLCKHPNIIGFERAILTTVKSNAKDKKGEKEYEIWIVMEHVNGGTLEVLARTQALQDIHVAFIAREVCRALAYLHERKFVHRDINPANIMVSLDGEIKLIDFGLAADVYDGPRYQMVGQPYYTPPEMIHRQGHSCPCDIWSLGAILLELFLGEPPLKKSSVLCLFTAATKGLVHLVPATSTETGKSFIEQCRVLDPDNRATADQLLKHPWINQPNLSLPTHLLQQIFLGNTTLKAF